MQILFDFVTFGAGTYFAYYSYKKAFDKNFATPSSYIQLLIYIFNCLPIIENYIFGMPTFQSDTWYQPLRQAMMVEEVNIIYDLYVFFAMLLLHFLVVRKSRKIIYNSSSKKWFFDNKYFWILLIASPILYIICTGNISNYLIYGTSEVRGLTGTEEGDFFNLTTFLLLSAFAFCVVFFRKKLKYSDIIILAVYTFVIGWICGKRYILAILLVLYLFFFCNSENYTDSAEKKLKKVLPILGIVLLLFSMIYLIYFKGSDRYELGGVKAIYDTIRVDFGRDCVIKFVIWKEFFLGEHILQYVGQSFISLILMFIPRSIWTNKPYQHFQYLTSSILGLPISDLPAGTTTSWFEMTLCNFSYFGFVFGIIGIVYFAYLVDKVHSTEMKSICLMLIMALLTMAPNSCIGYIAILIISLIFKLIFGKKRVIIRMN